MPHQRQRADATRGPRARGRRDTRIHEGALVDADSQRLPGAAILGLNGDEVVHSLPQVMAAGVPYTAISCGMHIHPTVSERVPTRLQQLKPLVLMLPREHARRQQLFARQP